MVDNQIEAGALEFFCKLAPCNGFGQYTTVMPIGLVPSNQVGRLGWREVMACYLTGVVVCEVDKFICFVGVPLRIGS